MGFARPTSRLKMPRSQIISQTQQTREYSNHQIDRKTSSCYNLQLSLFSHRRFGTARATNPGRRPNMAGFTQFGAAPKVKVIQKSSTEVFYVNYRDSESLRRLLTPNGKIQTRKRTGLNARQQRMAAQAIKRARYMGLLPYTSATL